MVVERLVGDQVVVERLIGDQVVKLRLVGRVIRAIGCRKIGLESSGYI